MNVELTTDFNSNDFVDGNSSAIQIGYKHTELGPVPLGWSIVAFGQIVARTQLGGNYKNSESDTGLPLIKMGNLGRGFVKLHKQEFIIGEASESDLLSYGDVLFNTRNTLELVGKVAIWKNELPKAYFNSNLMRISFKDEFVSSNIFMNALMNTEKFIKSLSDIAIGTTSVAAIYNRDLFQIKLVLPTKEEQTAIANALSDVDALIQELEKLIAKKQAIKTATMQQLLTGRTRLPQFAHHPDGRKKGYKPSELGEIPEDWEVVRLGDVGETIIGLTYSPNDVAEYGTLVLRSSNVQQGKLAYSDCVYVNMSLPDRVIVREGDILVCVRNGSRQLIGKCALIDKKAEGHAFGAFMSIYRTQYSKFVFYQFQSDLIQSQINEMMGATINQITNKDMASFLIGLPCDAKEQTEIAQICSDIDEEIQALEQRLNKTRQIKQGMMQELLTGKTRLVKPAGAA
ncbi:restriction endonuclease subunit S [Vibrio cholerae]|uniref:restriction endonuclease subunit S n=1 Tax=Vibrio cholerae TaxID=666 RepID=UPI0011D494C7|nr:restriction endonuclease subunit S [Vibrio cholerae]EGR2498340.1 restriction endonuclease subunit S [Vibrio cholerae]TYA83869.1 restriction endonuclease subunit S [Vibrio cholerae]GHY23562.1 restriction endonuclease subunit S [Vibrio cholerae]